MAGYSGESHVNVGVGNDLTIRELAEMMRDVVGFRANWFSTAANRTARRASWLTPH